MNKDKFIHFFLGLFLITGIVFKSSYTNAAEPLTQRKDVQDFIHTMVKKHHFKKKELTALFNQVQVQPKIIDSMTRPYEKRSWDVYKAIFIKPERVQEGIQFWQDNQKALELAEKKYHVPASIIVAILGVETRYGLRQGEYRVIDALSTLAFDYPRRAPFFQKELEQYLLLCREHKVSPTEYLGSYAGAMGKPQFMPSSYRFYADNFDGKTKKDLMHDNEAAIASVGNYFHQHGWKLGQPVTQKAKVQGDRYQSLNFTSRTADYSLAKLKKAGVTPLPPMPTATPKKAGVIELDIQTGQHHEYWVTYPNFYVITRYNTSPQYALVVYIFSEQLKQQWAKRKQSALSYQFS